MENDSNSNSSSQKTGVYGKIHRAVNGCPALRTIRRISPGSLRTSPATDSSPPSHPEKTPGIQSGKDSRKHDKSSKVAQARQTPDSGEATGTIPILFDYSNYSPNEKPKSAIPPSSILQNGQVPTNNLPVPSPVQVITKARPKTEPPPLERSSEGYKSGVHIEDRFTDYIKRAKIKIRTTSNVGDRKEPSVNDKFTKSNAGDKMELSANAQFTNYIRRTGAKIRITSRIGGSGNSAK